MAAGPEEQLTSYEAQVDYYTNYINGRDDWEFVSVYADHATIHGKDDVRFTFKDGTEIKV